MKKPTLLIVEKESASHQILQQKYDLVFYEPNDYTSPYTQVDDLLASLQGRRLDGVVGFHDLSSVVAAILAEQCHLTGPSPHAVYLAQNKTLFCQSLQEEQIPYPDTTLLDITREAPTFDYPIFLKPIKGRVSSSAFMISSQQELEQKLHLLREQDDTMKQAFAAFFQHFDDRYIPLSKWYLVQPFINAKQYTVDAFVFDQEVSILGVVQSIYTDDRKSFQRFDFPGDSPPQITDRLQVILEKIVKKLGFDYSGFNVEFFLTEEGEISLIEMNTRISQGFNWLYWEYYRDSMQEMMLDLALGRRPDLTVKAAPKQASSFPLRVPYDCLVTHVPSASEIAQLQKTFDVTRIELLVEEGKKLSDYWQDAYSFRYALVDIAGENLDDILARFSQFRKYLDIGLQPLE